MPKTNGDGPTQTTRPAEGEPVEIPVPTREEVFRDLDKVARAVAKSRGAPIKKGPPPLPHEKPSSPANGESSPEQQ